VTSSARHTVWSPPKDSTFEVRGEGPLAGPHPSAQDTFLKPPPMQLPSLLPAQGKLVSGPQLVPCAEGHSDSRCSESWRSSRSALPLLDAENIAEAVPLFLVGRIVKHLP
jgi:hypothetical protein